MLRLKASDPTPAVSMQYHHSEAREMAFTLVPGSLAQLSHRRARAIARFPLTLGLVRFTILRET